MSRKDDRFEAVLIAKSLWRPPWPELEIPSWNLKWASLSELHHRAMGSRLWW